MSFLKVIRHDQISLLILGGGMMKKPLIIVLLVFILILSMVFIRNQRMKEAPNDGLDVSWADSIVYNDQFYHVEYIYDEIDNHRKTVDESQINDFLGQVEFTLSENIINVSYELKEWDAAYLKKGTKVYSIKNISHYKSIAAHSDGKYYIYSRLDD